VAVRLQCHLQNIRFPAVITYTAGDSHRNSVSFILLIRTSYMKVNINNNANSTTTTNLGFRLLLLGFVCLPCSVNALSMPGTASYVAAPFSLKFPSKTTIDSKSIVASSSPSLEENDDGTLAALFGSHENRDLFFRHYFGTRSPVHIHRSQVKLDCSFLLPPPKEPSPTTMSAATSNNKNNHPRLNLIEHLFESCPYVTLREDGIPRPVDKSTMTWQAFQELIQQGCSAVIPVVQEKGFQALRASLEACFRKSVVMTIYHSGPNASALLPHTDSYDVFVLQLEGCKDWEIVQGYAETRRETSLTLQPGDVLYIPYNVIHSARASAGYESTTHLTIGLLNKWKPDDTLNYSKSINQKKNSYNSQ
jgi:hypothetical protein